ncbi:MAG TPA: hypothetical protein VJB70_01765 [Candidatus Paceibacterota bacterium]
MKTSYIITLAVVVLVVAGLADWYVFSTTEKRQPGMFPGKNADAAFVAEQWVAGSAPTYVFDGSNLALKESQEGGCEGCTDVLFSFESNHGGYGNRADLLVTQVITPHTIRVTVKDGTVTRAVTDEKYNEMSGALSE